MIEIVFVFVLLTAGFFISFYLYRKNKAEKEAVYEKLQEIVSRKQSLSTRYGKMTEQFMPFLRKYPYDKHNFRFIGSPVDGVQFCDDKVVFVEFKASDSRLTRKQKDVREIIRSGKVYFEEFRI